MGLFLGDFAIGVKREPDHAYPQYMKCTLAYVDLNWLTCGVNWFSCQVAI